MIATSYGTGEMILEAVELGSRRIIIGLGGSIVSDGGMGMAQALGAKFYSSDGSQLHPVENEGFNSLSLINVNNIDVSGVCKKLKTTSVIIAADVHTKLLGPGGQAHTFGPQKGATASQIIYRKGSLIGQIY